MVDNLKNKTMLYVFILASLADKSDTRFLLDMARLRYAINFGTQGQAKMHLYSNVDNYSWQLTELDHQYICDALKDVGNEFLLPSRNEIQHLSEFITDVYNLQGLTDQDRVLIYLTYHGSEESITSGNLSHALFHLANQGASVLLFVSARSSQYLIRTFCTERLNSEKQLPISIVTDDAEQCESHNVSLKERDNQVSTFVGTEFCQVLLTLLSDEDDPTTTIRVLHMRFPNKFVATFGTNGDASISEFFGPLIGVLKTNFAFRKEFQYVSTSFSNAGVPTLVSPKLRRLFKVVLGYDPNDEELSKEISDERFIKYKSQVEQIAKLLRKNEFIVIGKFPAGRSVFLLADVSIESIKMAIKLVNSETSNINSDIK
jgi:hypothetical protein